MKIYSISILCIAILVMACCKTKQKAAVSYTGQQTIIYKTKNDYSKNVPVMLSDDKSKIVAYPASKDVYYKGNLAYPTALTKGYWLDNRGITANSAFLKITYEEYSKLKEVPTLDSLYGQIIDKDPFTEIYNLGTRSQYKNEVADINVIIKKGDFQRFKKIK